MAKEKLVKYIYESNLVSQATAQLIAERFTALTIPKNAYLLKTGQISDAYFFMEEGYLRAFAEDINSNEVTTNFCGPGQMAFEVASFFNRTRSKESIQALADCRGWFITYAQLNGLFHEMPEFREFGRFTLVKGFSTLKNRMLATITEPAEERYRHLLVEQPELFHYASLKHIASYLGITDTSLSRIRAGFSKK
jgi:CRP-like cAMP-binding protein